MNENSQKTTTLTKKDFANLIIVHTHLEDSMAKELADTVSSTVKEILSQKRSILLKNIGTLAVSYKNARPGRNPKTKEECEIASRYTITLRKGKGKGMEKINKPEILKILEQKLPHYSKYIIAEAYKVFVFMISQISTGKIRIEIRGLGVFYPMFRKSGISRNPKTGEKIQTQEKIFVRFKCSKTILRTINL